MKLVPRNQRPSRSPLQRKRRPVQAAPHQQGPSQLPKPPSWHPYRYGATNVPPEQWDHRPRALLLFSGKSREGDIASYLAAGGWIVVVVDIVGPTTCDVLDSENYRLILKEVQDGGIRLRGYCHALRDAVTSQGESPRPQAIEGPGSS